MDLLSTFCYVFVDLEMETLQAKSFHITARILIYLFPTALMVLFSVNGMQ